MREYKSFENMPVWQKDMDIAVKIFEITESFPKKEDYGLTSQIRRAALSISANISEAFGRFHHADKLNFYYNARGSLAETKNHLIYAHKVAILLHFLQSSLISLARCQCHQIGRTGFQPVILRKLQKYRKWDT